MIKACQLYTVVPSNIAIKFKFNMSFLYSTEVPPREGEVPVPLSVYRSGSRARTCPGKCTAMLATPGKCPTAWIFFMGSKVRVAYIYCCIHNPHTFYSPALPPKWFQPCGGLGLSRWGSSHGFGVLDFNELVRPSDDQQSTSSTTETWQVTGRDW